MQDRIARIEETSCTARPDHTSGSSKERLKVGISRLLFLKKADAAGPCRGPRARAGLATGANVRLPIPIAGFRAQGRLGQFGAIN